MIVPNPSVAMARVVIDELCRNGLTALVLAPGSRSGAVAMAAADEVRLRLHVAIDERSAGFWAVGFAKATGRPAAVLTTSGTAVANLLPAVAEADRSGTPLVILSADRPAELRQSGANQTIDQVKIFGDRVRFFVDVPAASDFAGESAAWRSLVCQALFSARRGPVHLNLCFREPLVPASDDGRVKAAPYRSSIDGRANGNPWTRAQPPSPPVRSFPVQGRTLVVAGPGASLDIVEEAIVRGLVVVAEGHSGCRVPGTISAAHHLLGSASIRDGLRPERIVALGTPGLSRPLAALMAETDTTVVAGSWWDPARQAVEMAEMGGWEVTGTDQGWAQRWEEAEAIARRVLDASIDRLSEVTEPGIAREVVRAVPEGGLLAVGSSMPVRDVDWFAAPRRGLTVVGNRGASGIDGFVSMAAGAAIASGLPAVGLAGDVSLLHDANGLLTRPAPDLVIVLVNNSGGGIFSFLPQADFPENFERLFGTPSGVDFAGLIEAMGARHRPVGQTLDLRAAIDECLAAKGTEVIELRTDRGKNVAVHRELTNAVVAAVEPLFEG